MGFIRFLVICFLISNTGTSASKEGISFPDVLNITGKKLVLNGLGVREATIFKVDVYVAGLYVTKKSTDANTIINSPGPKHISMQFVRDVSAKDLRGAWKEALERNCEKECNRFNKNLEQLNAAMKDIKEGDKMAFTFLKNSTKVAVGKNASLKIAGGEFSKLLLSMWIGKPPNKGLKEGLLGS